MLLYYTIFIAFLWNKRKDNYCNIDNFSFNDIVHSTSATIYISYSTFGINIQAETTNNLIEIRNGLFRFRIETACFAMLLVFFVGNNC